MFSLLNVSLERLKLKTLNLVHWLAVWSIKIEMMNCTSSGHGHGSCDIFKFKEISDNIQGTDFVADIFGIRLGKLQSRANMWHCLHFAQSYVLPFWDNTGLWQTNGQTDRQIQAESKASRGKKKIRIGTRNSRLVSALFGLLKWNENCKRWRSPSMSATTVYDIVYAEHELCLSKCLLVQIIFSYILQNFILSTTVKVLI